MTAYYNERDPFAAQWLRELIDAGHIAPGVVDERSIEDVKPSDLTEYTQCHFFAGVGVWSYALRQAGWPDDRPVWTGSCPCQPFSAAGKGGGFADERHLWPAWFHLIQHGKQSDISILGEQVASGDGLAWLDLVQTDLEGAGYACWPVDLCAAGVGAPHIRQRLFFVGEWMGNPLGEGLEGHARHGDRAPGRSQPIGPITEASRISGLADTISSGGHNRRGMRSGHIEENSGGETPVWGGDRQLAEKPCTSGGLADSNSREQQGEPVVRGAECHGENPGRSQGGGSASPRGHSGGLAKPDSRGREPGGTASESARHGNSTEPASGTDRHQQPGPTNGLWRDADWLLCRDGKWRPVEPGTFPLAHGAPTRVGRLRGYGNAINAEVATAFIKAYLGTT